MISFNELRLAVAVIGTAFSKWLGGFDGLLEALIVFTVVDYVTGILSAIAEHNLSSEIGFKGIFRKILIFVLVAMANAIDVFIIEGDEQLLRTAVIFFYLSNEGISILENSARLGLPIPDKLREILAQLKNRDSK